MTRRALGALLALCLGAGIVHWRQQELASPHVRYDRFDLPGFDAHVYVAMAEQPGVFTVAPWGYRVLTPWLVHALPAGNAARGFRWVTVGALGAAAALLFLYLLRLGFTAAAALGGSALLALSGPVGEAARYRFLAEPLTLALEVAFLLAIEAGAGAGVLALIATGGVLGKEFFLLLLPLPWLRRRAAEGDAAAARVALLAALPAMAVWAGLRRVWGPRVTLAEALPGPGLVGEALQRLAGSWTEWAPAVLLAGLLPLALLGALRAGARPLRLPAAYLALATLVPPFLNPVAFFPADIPRLLLYALPLAIPLALLALDRVWPLHAPPGPPSPWPRSVEALAGAAAAALLAAALLGGDAYRRWDLRGPRDGPRLLAFCRETLRTARRLDRGQVVALEAEAHRFVWGLSDPGDLSRMRWFLGAGWGDHAHYGTGDMVMAGAEAALVLPLLTPRDLPLELDVVAAAPVDLELLVNGRPVARGRVGPGGSTVRATAPRAALFRGDNTLLLRAAGGGLVLGAYRLGGAP